MGHKWPVKMAYVHQELSTRIQLLLGSNTSQFQFFCTNVDLSQIFKHTVRVGGNLSAVETQIGSLAKILRNFLDYGKVLTINMIELSYAAFFFLFFFLLELFSERVLTSSPNVRFSGQDPKCFKMWLNTTQHIIHDLFH
jgi:hypothetical protein